MPLASPPHGWRGRDPKGDGAFLADRVRHKTNGEDWVDFHWGRDALCIPGEDWRCPANGILLRARSPYERDPVWGGYLLRTEAGLLLTEFYVDLDRSLVGHEVTRGQVLGTAQDIRLKYGIKMLPHVHREVRLPNGYRLPLSWIRGVDYEMRTTGTYPGTYADPMKLEAA